MTRKANNKNKQSVPSVETSDANVELESQEVTETVEITHHVLLESKALKLSPKTTNHVFYEVARNQTDDELYVRLTGNEGGGLHSKEWLKLVDVLAVLEEQEDKPFKSSVLKSVFKGGSANNAGFLAACLRGMELTIQSEKSVFLHVLGPEFATRRDELLALGEPETETH